MAISNTRQIKVLLLLAGYLFVVLSHILFVLPKNIDYGKLAANPFVIVAKNHDKSGKGIINVKKIYKSVINRNLSDKQVNTPAELYVATLLYDVSLHIIKADRDFVYSRSSHGSPLTQRYHLRI